MKVLDIVSIETPSALLGQRNVPNLFKTLKPKRSKPMKVKKSNYGLGGVVNASGGNVGNSAPGCPAGGTGVGGTGGGGGGGGK